MEKMNYAFGYLPPQIESGVCQERSTFMLWIQSKESFLARGEFEQGFTENVAFQVHH